MSQGSFARWWFAAGWFLAWVPMGCAVLVVQDSPSRWVRAGLTVAFVVIAGWLYSLPALVRDGRLRPPR